MNRLKTFFKDLFFMKKSLFLNLLFLITITGGIIFVLMKGLSIYTLQGETIVVPDLTNMKVKEAQKLLETRKLEFIVKDSICRTQEMNIGGLIKEQMP